MYSKVKSTKLTKKSTAGKRREARAVVERELEEINTIVSQVLGGS